jgi:hypothetical protein
MRFTTRKVCGESELVLVASLVMAAETAVEAERRMTQPAA